MSFKEKFEEFADNLENFCYTIVSKAGLMIVLVAIALGIMGIIACIVVCYSDSLKTHTIILSSKTTGKQDTIRNCGYSESKYGQLTIYKKDGTHIRYSGEYLILEGGVNNDK